MSLRFWLFVLGVSLACTPAVAQPDSSRADEADVRAVRATLEALFDGMRAGDSAAVRAVFHEEARLHTAHGPSDTTTTAATSVDAFVRAVAQPRDATWDERTWDVEVRVDGPLASAWVPYAFYLGDRLSHCGVNAVQLVEGKDGWRILQLTDTRRDPCSVPADVQK